ncbi:MAG: DMP19 family protein [Cytophaga sp.]|uniref:DMP19 family protein n=1 Tax=Cytophaga sp. TaxID=29535 RepID=UPI003F7F0788
MSILKTFSSLFSRADKNVAASSKVSLTAELIDETDDTHLLQLVFDLLFDGLPNRIKKEYEIVMNWNEYKRSFFMITLLQGEVDNGGYGQFYFNSSGIYYKHLPAALKFVGAFDFAHVTEKANQLFEKNRSLFVKFPNELYDDLSDQFYDLDGKGKLDQLKIDFIRKHKNEFVS